MTTNLNLRLIALKKMGGTKTLRILPREKRALALASLMNEGPEKIRSSKACQMTAFACAVERGDVSAAKKLFQRLSSADERKQAKKIVSAKVKTLREEKKDAIADLFEVSFGLSEEAKSRFVAGMKEKLGEAKQKLESDYVFAHVPFTKILEDAELAEIPYITQDAAIGLATFHIRGCRVNDALDTIEKYLMNDGQLAEGADIWLIPEIRKMLERTSKHVLNEIAKHAKKKGLLPLMQKAVLDLALLKRFKGAEKNMEVLDLMLIFGLNEDAQRLGKGIITVFMTHADLFPKKNYKMYLGAARTAVWINNLDAGDEAMNKYLAVSRELGEENPEILGEVALAAMEFSWYIEAKELGRKAFAHYISNGNLEEAEMIAREVMLVDLQFVAKEMRNRTEW